MAPAAIVDLDGLAEAWFETDIIWTIAGSSAAIGDPGFPGRVRGAFGAELMDGASPEALAGQPCPWEPPCAFGVIFQKQGRMDPGLEFPGPWVIEVDAEGADLLVTLRLFGFATDYAGAAAEAMGKALTARLDYAGSSGQFFPRPHVIARTILARPGLALSPPSAPVLDFLSPVLLTSIDVIEHPRSLLTTAAARIAGLARWHDLELSLDRAALVDLSHRLDFFWLDAVGLRWKRRSRKQNREIRMAGTIGRLAIDGSEPDLHLAGRIFAFGQRCHIGADAAYGCGRFDFQREHGT
ncbi:CRISPR system precrRNA processing endoribonuclease RAMP protein Cas6 [Hoeflea marina]|nr:CRISPR system precrRNA processing endoribonuclease RAMP protein Cas6 [Hoeflea marina]